MTGDRQATRQPIWSTRLWSTRLSAVALVAALAILSGGVLPLLHAATGHVSECTMCEVFAHGGANVAEAAPPLDVATPPAVSTSEPHAPAAVVALRSLDSRDARAPPVPSVSI